jgi:hypothetical protein
VRTVKRSFLEGKMALQRVPEANGFGTLGEARGLSLARSYFAINEPGFGGFERWVGWTVAMLIWTA